MDWPLDPSPLEINHEVEEKEASLLLQRDTQQSMRRIAIALERLLFLYGQDIERRNHTV